MEQWEYKVKAVFQFHWHEIRRWWKIVPPTPPASGFGRAGIGTVPLCIIIML